MKAIMTGSHTHTHTHTHARVPTDSHLLGKSWDIAGSTLTHGREKNLSPDFFVATVVLMMYCQDKVLSRSCDYMQIWRAFQFFLVVFDIRVELINISSTRVLKNITRGPHVCTNILARRL